MGSADLPAGAVASWSARLETSTAIPRLRRDVPLRPGSGYVDALPGARPAATALARLAYCQLPRRDRGRSSRMAADQGRLALGDERGDGRDASEESAAPESAVFRGLSGLAIADRIPEGALAAGLEGDFSGHSPRIGMARDLAASGASTTALMLVTGPRRRGQAVSYYSPTLSWWTIRWRRRADPRGW